MSVTSAQAAAQELRTALLDNGVRAVSIELQPGVGPTADPWHCTTFKRGMGHHIASYPSQGATPGLGVVKKGRGQPNPLTGPLANCYGGFDLTARIITMGWSNHPGAGGPWTVPGWGTVPRDNGRPYILGWEFEGGHLPYTDAMHHFMACCAAGTLDWLGNAPLECWGEHRDPWAPGRKVDRIGYTAASGRARIAAVRGTTSQEDDDLNSDQDLRLTQARDAATGADNRAGDILSRVIDLQSKVVGYGTRTEHDQAVGIANAAVLSQIATALAGGPRIDVENITAAIKAGVIEGVTARLLTIVTDVVRAELGADNATQANAIVAALGAKLAS